MNENNIKNDIPEENEPDYITLTDEEGNDVSFEILGEIEYQNRYFAVLLPFDENDDGVVILEELPCEDPDYIDFVGIDDEKLLDKVFDKFKENYSDKYDFE